MASNAGGEGETLDAVLTGVLEERGGEGRREEGGGGKGGRAAEISCSCTRHTLSPA